MQNADYKPVATSQSGDVNVTLYRIDDDYRFTVTVQERRASVIYRQVPNGWLRFTIYEGDPAFFTQLSTAQFQRVEQGVWQCMRDGMNTIPLATSAEPT